MSLFLAIANVIALGQVTETWIPTGSTWRWRKGTNEVSTPASLWRNTVFGDGSWPLGVAPFHYGNNGSTGDDGITDGTILTDMRTRYRCVFLRRTFSITNMAEISGVRLVANYDDGFVAWINGIEVARSFFTNASPLYTHVASGSHEAGTAVTFTIGLPPGNYLVNGNNALTIQAFNQSLSGSSDFRIDARLEATRIDTTPLALANVEPSANSIVSSLSQATVTFNKPVSGVDASDFLINDQPASSLIGSPGTNRYTFVFAAPAPGLIHFAWNEAHGITGLGAEAFDPAGANAAWNVTLVDTAAPVISDTTPVASAVVSQFSQVEVRFNEPVSGVEASDLRLNGQIANGVSGSDSGPYVFQFQQPAVNGTMTFSWAPAHGIRDVTSNSFAGGSWSVILNTTLSHGDIVINEFVAGNTTGLIDENSTQQDWIELHNRGAQAVNLLGWSLTDDPEVPGKWTFPARVISPGEYLVVFASEKDRRAPTGTNRFHTNFKLNLFGEYLALFNPEYPRQPVSVLEPEFPEQRNNYSHGRNAADAWRYYQTPTPGAANGESPIFGIAAPPHFTIPRGIFNQPFQLALTSAPGGVIRYTLDGSEPTPSTGFIYSQPLNITNTTLVRAITVAPGTLPSRTVTHSYLYLGSVLSQPANPPGFPSTWGTSQSFPTPNVPADYAMDLDPIRLNPLNPASALDPEKLARYEKGIRELPVVSLVLRRDDMFGAGGLYPNSSSGNKASNEKSCSVEMILPDGSSAFAVSAGIDLHGNASRDPFKNPKHGFKLNFKGDYGETTLEYRLFTDSPAEKFDDLILRPDFGVSWRHWSDSPDDPLGAMQRTRASPTRDAWMKEAFRDMGNPASYTRYFHLMINGLYWGVYDFTEQPTGQFGENYLAASTNGYDIYDQGGVTTTAGGNSAAYNTMLGISNLGDNSNYERMKQYLDVTCYADYMLLCFYCGAQDWGTAKNWFAIRARIPGPAGTFKYMPWDGENILLDSHINRVPGAQGDVPSGLHLKLDDNPQYRLDFADRVHKHMIAPDGALTPEANVARWQKWEAVLDAPIVAESMRWGDYRRDVHPYQNGTFQLYTRESHWLAENERVVNTYVPTRHATVMNQLRAAGLYPAVEAPEFRQNHIAGPVLGSRQAASGFIVAMHNPNPGTIYFTTNGSDPRVAYSGIVAPSAQAYSAPLTLNSTTILKARVLNGGTWSALNEATFTIAQLGVPLRITEIMYNPEGGDAYEFIELMNVGAQALDISLFSFDGITLTFPSGTSIPANGLLVLANSASPAAFATRHPSTPVFAYFGGSLMNSGERIALLDRGGNTVVAVHYDDEDGWPLAADGGGASAGIIEVAGDLSAPSNWQAIAGGSPGLPPQAAAAAEVVINEVMADNATAVGNGGGFPDWIELHNTGASVVNLANWSLSDESAPRQYVLPATNLPPGGFLVIWCDSATNAPGLHTRFALSKSGETVSLFNSNTQRVDAVTLGLQLTDYSVGRINGDWVLTVPTPGGANESAALESQNHLTINEWLPNPLTGGQDWIELFNQSPASPVSLRGIYIQTSNTVARLGSLSFVSPNSFVQLFADERAGANQLDLKLSSEGGRIALLDAAGIQIEEVSYSAVAEAVSQGRLPDGSQNVASFPASVSPGAGNYTLTYTGPTLNEILGRNDHAVLSPWDTYVDFIELRNPAASPVSLDGMALARSVAIAERWTFPAGTTIAANGYIVVWCDSSRSASTSSGGALNTGFSLPGEGARVYLFNGSGQIVDDLAYGFQVEDRPIGIVGGQWQLLNTPTPGTVNSAAAALGPVAGLRFNEWMAAPVLGYDWFEIFNSNALPANISGLYVTDNPSISTLTNSPLPALSFIDGRDWIQLFASNGDETGPQHTRFALSANGETLGLYNTNLTLIDSLHFGVQASGISQGRLPDGGTNVVSFVNTASPAAANWLPLESVVINEILSHTDAPLEDAIELHNTTANPVNIGGWFLSDSQSDLKRYRIPDNTIVAAGGYRVFYQNQFGGTDGDNEEPPFFTFNSARGDSAHLSQADAAGNLGGLRSTVSFGAAPNGISFGRFQTSVETEFVAMSQRTFGVDNPATLPQFRSGTGASNAYPLVGPIVISEIMYHPEVETDPGNHHEYIELHNLSDSPVALYDPAHPGNTWRLANAVEFSFASGTVISNRGTLTVVGFNPAADATALAAFQAEYGLVGPLTGPFSGRLNNAGESVELWRPDAPQTPPHPDAGFLPLILVERVVYSDAGGWPAAADGMGPSLHRLVANHFGNDPFNWIAAPASPGLGHVPIDPPIATAQRSGNEIHLMFTVSPGHGYQVQWKERLTDPSWTPLGSPIIANTAQLLVTDTIISQISGRFYRLVLVP
ncbi:MAG TPA: lamin tail domain-containing protein [Verrucomicrobiae bacterium]|nr:lamin tail domain-containing protein [Verrucomicrobiae bacterium]